MLDDLLKKIKNALPEKIRAKVFKSKDDEDEELDEDELDEDDEGEEEDDEVTEERTQTDLSDDSEEDDDDEDDEEDDEDEEELDEEEEKKKKKQKIIRIVAVLFIVYLAFDTFMAPTDGPEDVAVEDTPPPAKPKGVTGIVEEEAPKKPRGIVEEPTEQEPVAQTEPEPAPQEPVVRAEPEPAPQEPVVRAEPEPAPQEPVVQTEPEPAQQEPVAQTEPPVVSGGESTSVGMVEQPDTLEVEQVEEVDSRQKEASMMKQIVSAVNEKLEYVEPPDYLKSGRGLVYNCEGRHWACVERESYFQCRDNMRWSAQEKKAPECYTKDVYATMDDCRVVQIHYINTAEPTDFCESP